MRTHIYARVPNYRPPPELLDDVGEDNGLSADRRSQARIADAFRALHDRPHAWAPGVLMVIADDQAENALVDGLPVVALFTGTEVE